MSSVKVSSHLSSLYLWFSDTESLQELPGYAHLVHTVPKSMLETSEEAAKSLDPLRAAKNYWWSVAHIWKEVMTVVSVWPLPLFSRSIKGVREPGCRRHLQVLDTAGVLLYGENTALGRLGHNDMPPWLVVCADESIFWATKIQSIESGPYH